MSPHSGNLSCHCSGKAIAYMAPLDPGVETGYVSSSSTGFARCPTVSPMLDEVAPCNCGCDEDQAGGMAQFFRKHGRASYLGVGARSSFSRDTPGVQESFAAPAASPVDDYANR